MCSEISFLFLVWYYRDQDRYRSEFQIPTEIFLHGKYLSLLQCRQSIWYVTDVSTEEYESRMEGNQ